MKLDMDCVRDVLLCVEEHTGLRKCCSFVDEGLSNVATFLGHETLIKDYQIELEERYDNDKLIYHVNYCVDANLVLKIDGSNSQTISISDLTPAGHDYLSNIRDNNNWSKVKKIAGKVGSSSLSSFITIASELITGLIKSEFMAAIK